MTQLKAVANGFVMTLLVALFFIGLMAAVLYIGHVMDLMTYMPQGPAQ